VFCFAPDGHGTYIEQDAAGVWRCTFCRQPDQWEKGGTPARAGKYVDKDGKPVGKRALEGEQLQFFNDLRAFTASHPGVTIGVIAAHFKRTVGALHQRMQRLRSAGYITWDERHITTLRFL
jgi:hypothetical protein